VNYILVAGIAFFVSYILTPFIAQVGKKQNFVDKPGYRKIHNDAIPNLGGIVIFFGFLLSILFIIPIQGKMKALLAGSVIILLLGVVDDIVDLRPRYKFIIQMIPALLVIGYHYQVINQFISQQLSLLHIMGYLLYPVLLFWIVGVTNSINLIDGLDGLACGVSIISLTTFFILGLLINGYFELYNLLTIALLGSMLAFFRYNFYPAQIFLGDSGSTFAGFMIASIGTLWVIFSGNVVFLIVPLIILAIPVGDTLFAIWRRYRNHKPIFLADQGHMHHRLLNRGISHRNVVLILLGTNVICCLIALMIVLSGK
jgi:UDP-GlcNAc:undecaprenyl-phosphate/decaprenyl-phosphate GlcNAc-1-phosphate transferase